MYPDDYKSDFKIISQEQNAAGSCIYAFLQAKKYAYECECCGSNDIASKGFWKKKNFRDITCNGETVYLTIELRRYSCKNCVSKLKAAGKKSGKLEENGRLIQSTYTVNCLPECAPADAKISASIVDEIIKIIATQHLTVREGADRMNVSPSSVSEALQKRRERAEQSIASFREPDCFLVYPFNYVKPERCALIGLEGDRPMLYGLLENCEAETIQAFLNERDTKDGRSWNLYTVLTDFPRPNEHQMLDTRYERAQLGILRECVLDRVAKLRKKNYSRKVLAIIDDALAELSLVLETHIYDSVNDHFVPVNKLSPEVQDDVLEDGMFDEKAQASFLTMFHNWWDALPESAQERLDEFYKDVNAQYKKIVTGFTSIKLERNPSNLLRFISICRARKIPFDDLTGWLALVAGVHNKENVSAIQMMSSSFVPQPIHDFYIDLDELNDLLTK